MAQKHVYFFGPQGTEGDATMKNSLGGKGANLAEMASLGLPGLAGFWGEFPAVLSAFEPSKLANSLLGGSDNLWTYRSFMVIAAIGTVLAAGYLLWMYQRVAMGTPKAEFEDAHIHDVYPSEWIAWTPLLIGIVVFGLLPNLIFSLTNGPAQLITRAFKG